MRALRHFSGFSLAICWRCRRWSCWGERWGPLRSQKDSGDRHRLVRRGVAALWRLPGHCDASGGSCPGGHRRSAGQSRKPGDHPGELPGVGSGRRSGRLVGVGRHRRGGRALRGRRPGWRAGVEVGIPDQCSDRRRRGGSGVRGSPGEPRYRHVRAPGLAGRVDGQWRPGRRHLGVDRGRSPRVDGSSCAGHPCGGCDAGGRVRLARAPGPAIRLFHQRSFATEPSPS